MMVVGPTGVGKSSLLNSLMCPAKWSTEFEDCHFKTSDTLESVTKNISQVVGPWLGENEPPVHLVKVFDTPGLGDSSGLSDIDTLKGIVETINSEPVQAILLVFRSKDNVEGSIRLIQKQLRTLEYVLGPQVWDHVISVFTFWGFSTKDIRDRVRECIVERKDQFDGVRNYCKEADFENEIAEELKEGYKKYFGVTKTIPHAFSHPVFDYEDEEERKIFFENARKIYNYAENMSALQCDVECERRLENST